MRTLSLLLLITLCYATYNLLIKVSSQFASGGVPPVFATICLQAAALGVSVVYWFYLLRQGVSMALPSRAYLWATGAGLAIGLAEILYFYLLRGVGGEKPMDASSAIPLVVGGTIVISVVVAYFIFNETLSRGQWLGVGLAFTGLLMIAWR